MRNVPLSIGISFSVLKALNKVMSQIFASFTYICNCEKILKYGLSITKHIYTFSKLKMIALGYDCMITTKTHHTMQAVGL